MRFICLADVKAMCVPFRTHNSKALVKTHFHSLVETLKKNLFYCLLHKRSFILPILICTRWDSGRILFFLTVTDLGNQDH